MVWDPPREFDGFELKWLLGQGGMGRVYLAREASLDREVTLKFIQGDDPGIDARARFLQEARAIARLQHPNIVAIYRFGEVDGRPYIAYEYVRGKSLDQIAKPVSWTVALSVGLAVTRGLALAHSRGVLHRDVKPANVILASEGVIKLVDFGLAKLLIDEPSGAHSSAEEILRRLEARSQGQLENADTSLPSRTVPAHRDAKETLEDASTQTAGLIGTPNYLAPEVWRGERASSRSDVYAVGLVLHELCSGRGAFTGLTGLELMDRVLDTTLPPLASLCPDLPRSFAAIVDRAAAHEPDERFADGGEMLSALEVVDRVLRGFQMLGERRGHADDVSLVAASLSRVQAQADAVFSAHYQRLFETTPRFERLFPTSLVDQKMMLAAALRLAVDNLRNPDKLTPVLEDLGRRHVSYGVSASDLPLFAQALVSTLRDFDSGWDDATERAWTRALAAIGEALGHGMDWVPLRKGA